MSTILIGVDASPRSADAIASAPASRTSRPGPSHRHGPVIVMPRGAHASFPEPTPPP
jgi:hypothetical protein